MIDFNSDVVAYILLIFMLEAMVLTTWMRYSIFSTRSLSSRLTEKRNTPSESPLAILNQHYVRGEISKAGYEEMCRNPEMQHRS